MLRLIKYLKPYIFLIALSFTLLFVRANAELALPDYMSRIVNIGIQQRGVENAVPIAIRQAEMEKLTIFMDPEEKTRVLSNYTLVDRNSPDYEAYVTLYPALAKEPVFVLKDLGGDEEAWLNPVMGKSFMALSTIQQALEDPAKAEALSSSTGIDLGSLPAGTDISTLLGELTESQLSRLSSMFDGMHTAMGERTIIQSAAAPIRAEYTALGMDTGKLSSDYIIRVGFLMLLVTLLAGVCAVIVSFLSSRVASGFARDLRRNLFQRVESFSSAEFNKFSTASLITRSTNDITQIQMVVIMTLRLVAFAPVMAIGGVIHALAKSPTMWWTIALAVVILLCLILIVFSIALPKFKIIQSLIDRLNLVTRENLSGMMVIRAFNRESFEEARFDKANTDLTSVNLFINRVMVTMMPLMMLVMNGVSVLIIWVGSNQVAQSSMQVGDMIAFMQYAMQIVFSFLMMAMMFITLPRAAVSGDRIADVLETDPSINDPQDPKRFPEPFKGTVEFKDVSFRYPGAEEDVLHNISFTASPGQTTALIGTTGSGKSTIASLIPRFYDVTNGAVCVDGVDIREVAQHDLREQIGFVPQKGLLFSGTIESNLLYGDEYASDEELKLAADIAQATEFIEAKSEGMQAEVAQGGTNVSGGQKQRLSIARALVKKAPIYIFDDSFSALDYKTDAALRRAIREHTGTSTMIIITQRIATIKNAEQILVLDEGSIIGMGSHDQLMKDCQVYRGIALSQLSKEELS